MQMMSLPAVWALITVAFAGAVASDAAQARSAFDGGWAVQIVTQRGACDPSSGFGVEIRDGVIYGSGGMPVHGRVAGNGAARRQGLLPGRIGEIELHAILGSR